MSGLALAALLCAAAAGPRVVVDDFSGPTADDVRGAVIRVLSEREEIELVSTGELLDAARRAGVDLASPEGRAAAEDALRVAARVRGEVVRRGGRWSARVEALHRPGDAVQARLSVGAGSLRELDDAVARRLWPQLGAALSSAPPPRVARKVLLLGQEGPSGGLARVVGAFEAAPWLDVQVFGGAAPSGARMLAQLARDRGLDGFVELELTRRRRRWSAQASVVGPDGRARETVRAEGRRTSQIAEQLLDGLAAALDAVQPAPPPPPAPAPERASPPPRSPSPPAGTASAPRAERRSGLDPIELGASLRVLGRNLSYSDDLFGGLRPYDLAGAPVVRLEGAWFPGAHVGDGPLSWVGIELQGDLALGLSSSDAAGRSFGTSAFALHGGLRGRIPIGAHQLGLSAGAGLDAFTIDAASDGTDPDLPSVSYSFLRFGADGRFALTEALSVQAGLGWRQVLGLGELGEAGWFPNASAAGLDARVRVGWALVDGLELQVGGELRRYFSSFDPRPGDFPVAGGATDQLWSAGLGAVYRL